MRRAPRVTALAVLLPLTACDGPSLLQLAFDPVSALDLGLVPAADTALPGYGVPLTIIVRNPTSVPISFSGGGCAIGYDVFLPNGDRVEGDLVCRGSLETWTVEPGDSLLVGDSFSGWQRTSFLREIPDTGFSPGTYGLRPYVRAPEGRREGPAVPIAVLSSTTARFVHTAALPPLDFVVGNWTPAANLAPGLFTRPRVVRTGLQTVEIRDHRDGRLLGSSVITFREGVTHTVGVRATASGFEPVDVADPALSPDPDRGLFRLVHLAAGAPPIAVHLIRPDPAGDETVDPFPYGAATPYLPSADGRWTVTVTTPGGADQLLGSAPIPVAPGQVRTLMLIDDGSGGVTWVLLDP